MQKVENLKKITLIHEGSKFDVKLPSGRVILMREQNGGDDDTLSRIGQGDGTNILSFLSNIIVKDYTTGSKPLVTDVEKWLLKDKYYALFKSRQHSLGHDFKFQYSCSNPKCPTEGAIKTFTEDLRAFDYAGQKDEEGRNITPSEYCVTPYESAEQVIELTLSSNKKVRFKLLDSILEKGQLAQSGEDFSQNSQFRDRQLELFFEGEYLPVEDFQIFSSKDMVELRAAVKKYDRQFTPLMRVICPTCQNQEYVNMLLHPDFFYPSEI